MFTVSVEKECGCFKKSAYENNMSFDSREDALLQANLMITHMNTKFCEKHEFDINENGNNIMISVSDATAQKSCCGSGHCS